MINLGEHQPLKNVWAELARQKAEIERLHSSLDDAYREVKRLMDENAWLLEERKQLLAALQMVRTVILRECLELRFSNAEVTQIDDAIAKSSGSDDSPNNRRNLL